MDLSPAPRPPVALLIDGENLGPTLAPAALAAARRCGDLRIRRVYGALAAIAGWGDLGFRLCPTRPGKNSADMLLCVEAMRLAHKDGLGTVLIASSDRDFSYLAESLREDGIRVIGLGTEKAPEGFRSACSEFTVLAPIGTAPAPAAPKPAPPAAPAKGMVEAVRATIKGAGATGYPVASLGPALGRAGHKVSDTPEKTWRKWLMARGNLFEIDPKGPNARVRLKA